jgi:light-regulated signal transduction histidine kinase (bacteriophytochrome)
MQVTSDITKDFPDISLRAGPNVIAGVLHVPLSAGGKDFIALLRKGQLREVTWAGRVSKGARGQVSLEPRASFKAWSEIISSRSRAWTDEQLETAGVLALVYGKVRTDVVRCRKDALKGFIQFIDVWRQKETAVKATQLTNLLLSNASHEGAHLSIHG